jgi:hypothetical protein
MIGFLAMHCMHSLLSTLVAVVGGFGHCRPAWQVHAELPLLGLCTFVDGSMCKLPIVGDACRQLAYSFLSGSLGPWATPTVTNHTRHSKHVKGRSR